MIISATALFSWPGVPQHRHESVPICGETTRLEALSWAAQAKDALAPLPDHPIKGMLLDLADYVVARVR